MPRGAVKSIVSAGSITDAFTELDSPVPVILRLTVLSVLLSDSKITSFSFSYTSAPAGSVPSDDITAETASPF